MNQKWRHIYIIGFYSFLLICIKFGFDAVYGGIIHPPITDPTTTLGWFELFENDSFFGLFCFNFFDVFWMICLVPFYAALFFSLRNVNKPFSLICILFGLIGIICYISANNALSFLQGYLEKLI
jgi:hypothetical protein